MTTPGTPVFQSSCEGTSGRLMEEEGRESSGVCGLSWDAVE